MKIAHLSTTHQGGAGIAARHLSRALNLHHMKSSFFALQANSYSAGDNEFSIVRPLKNKAAAKVTTSVNLAISKESFFSLFSTSVDIKATIQAESFDVVHIHNFYNLLSPSFFEQLTDLSIPIVITLHDQRLFTGGCHYSLDCQNFTAGCNDCPIVPTLLSQLPSLNLEKMKSLFGSRDIHIIAPSEWMLLAAKKSTLLSQSNLYQIENHLLEPLTHNKIHSKPKRSLDELPCFGVASMDPFSKIKGGVFLNRLMLELQKVHQNFEIVFLKDTKEDMYEDNFWQRIEFLLVPSLIDNSPNVIKEASMRGIPVVATNVGGIPELLELPFDYLVENSATGVEALLAYVKSKKYYRKDKMKQDRARRARANNIRALREHIDLYNFVVS